MPSSRPKSRLADILNAISMIEEFVVGAGGLEAAVKRDTLHRDAIERRLLIIAEAAAKLRGQGGGCAGNRLGRRQGDGQSDPARLRRGRHRNCPIRSPRPSRSAEAGVSPPAGETLTRLPRLPLSRIRRGFTGCGPLSAVRSSMAKGGGSGEPTRMVRPFGPPAPQPFRRDESL